MSCFRRALTLVLAVGLTGGTLLTPALRHSHAIREHSNSKVNAASHSHVPSHGHSHAASHGHSHNHDHVDHRHGEDASLPLSDPPVEHLHIFWFGFELTLLVSPEDFLRRGTSVAEWVPLHGELVLSQVVNVSDLLDFASWDVGRATTAGLMPIPATSLNLQMISPLCGTARRERSGVLNI